jgi:hypothetical protein
MSERIHCDCCDAVIPDGITRLTLQCGTAKADTWQHEDKPRDYCADCVERIPLLKNIFAEQFEEGMDPPVVRRR